MDLLIELSVQREEFVWYSVLLVHHSAQLWYLFQISLLAFDCFQTGNHGEKIIFGLELCCHWRKNGPAKYFSRNLKWKGTENWLKFVLHQANPFQFISMVNQQCFHWDSNIHSWIKWMASTTQQSFLFRHRIIVLHCRRCSLKGLLFCFFSSVSFRINENEKKTQAQEMTASARHKH